MSLLAVPPARVVVALLLCALATGTLSQDNVGVGAWHDHTRSEALLDSCSGGTYKPPLAGMLTSVHIPIHLEGS